MIKHNNKKAGATIAAIVIILILTGCSLQNPVAPSWETTVNLPLINNSTCIGDFIDLNLIGGKDSLHPVIILPSTGVNTTVREISVSALKGIIIGGVININIVNRLALNFDTIVIYISRYSEEVYQQPEAIIGPINIQAATVDSDGNVVESQSSIQNIILGEKVMSVLGNETGKVFVGCHLVTNGTNGQPVKINASDYLKTIVVVSAKVKVS